MKVKSIMGKLLLIGAVASMSCMPAFAAENSNEVKDTNTCIIVSNDNGTYEYSEVKSDEQIDLTTCAQAKFTKEDGKIFYEGSEGKKLFNSEGINVNNAQIAEDGSLNYVDTDGIKISFKIYYKTVNQEVVYYNIGTATDK